MHLRIMKKSKSWKAEEATAKKFDLISNKNTYKVTETTSLSASSKPRCRNTKKCIF